MASGVSGSPRSAESSRDGALRRTPGGSPTPQSTRFKNLDRAYRNRFEGRAERRRFHKKGQRDAFRESDPKVFAWTTTTVE
jgi:hypothetical protein